LTIPTLDVLIVVWQVDISGVRIIIGSVILTQVWITWYNKDI